MKDIFNLSYDSFSSQKLADENERIKITGQIIDYIKNRYRTILTEDKYQHDEIESILNSDDHDLYDLYLRINALKNFRKDKKFKDLLIALKRMANIIKGVNIEVEFNASLLKQREEKVLYETFQKKSAHFNDLISNKKYHDTFQLLSTYKEKVDLFFDKVLVMDNNSMIKNNRLALLKMLVNHFRQLLDFSSISEKK